MDALRALVPDAGSYLSESDFFDARWRESFWGQNYPRLLAVKRAYDRTGSSSCTTAWAARTGARTASRERVEAPISLVHRGGVESGRNPDRRSRGQLPRPSPSWSTRGGAVPVSFFICRGCVAGAHIERSRHWTRVPTLPRFIQRERTGMPPIVTVLVTARCNGLRRGWDGLPDPCRDPDRDYECVRRFAAGSSFGGADAPGDTRPGTGQAKADEAIPAEPAGAAIRATASNGADHAPRADARRPTSRLLGNRWSDHPHGPTAIAAPMGNPRLFSMLMMWAPPSESQGWRAGSAPSIWIPRQPVGGNLNLPVPQVTGSPLHPA